MSVSEPGKIITPWAESGLKNTIPPAANPATGRAGFDQGFSAINMTAKEAGGIPPFGQDFNGIFYEVTNILRYMQAGGQPTFDAALAAAIGGYPKGAMVLGNDGTSVYKNIVDSNSSNPNSGGGGWAREDLMLREALRRSYAEAGLNLVDGSFEEGGTLTSASDVLLHKATGAAYAWSGAFPKVVAAGSTPATSGGVGAGAWVDRTDVTFRSDLASENGSGLVGYQPAGTGAVATDVQSKLRESVSVKDFGAVGDGSNELTKLNNALATGGTVVNDMNLTVSGTALIPARGTLKSDSSKTITYTSATDFGIALRGYSSILGGHHKFTNFAGVYVSGDQAAKIHGARLENTSTSNSIAVNVNSSNAAYTNILGNHIEAVGYGVLTNGSATNVHGIPIVANTVISSEGDAVELNAPLKNHYSIPVVGNVLASMGGTSVNNGFAFGLARARGVPFVGNAIEQSRQEAIHIEDEQHTNVVVGNTALNCNQEGVLVGSWSTGLAEGLPIVGNNFRAAVGNKTFAGAIQTYDQNPAPEGLALIGNSFTNFYRGIVTAPKDVLTVGNVIKSASDTALHSTGGGRLHGANLVIDTQTLAKSDQASVFGKTIATTTPVTILDTAKHPANTLGSFMKGFAFPKNSQTVTATNTTIDLFPLPQRMKGILTCTVRSNGGPAEHIFFSADVLYDGSTLTVSNSVKKSYGIMDVGSADFYAVNDGNLAVVIYLVNGTRNVNVYVDFEGVYYK